MCADRGLIEPETQLTHRGTVERSPNVRRPICERRGGICMCCLRFRFQCAQSAKLATPSSSSSSSCSGNGVRTQRASGQVLRDQLCACVCVCISGLYYIQYTIHVFISLSKIIANCARLHHEHNVRMHVCTRLGSNVRAPRAIERSYTHMSMSGVYNIYTHM